LKPGFSRKFGPEVRKLENSVKHTSWYNFSARVRRRGCAPGRTYVSDLSRISLLRHRLLDCHNRTGRSQHLRAPRWRVEFRPPRVARRFFRNSPERHRTRNRVPTCGKPASQIADRADNCDS